MARVGLVGDSPLLPPQHAAQDPEFLQIPAVASNGADHLQQDPTFERIVYPFQILFDGSEHETVSVDNCEDVP